MKEKRDYRRYHNPGLLLLRQRPILWVCSGLPATWQTRSQKSQVPRTRNKNFLEVIWNSKISGPHATVESQNHKGPPSSGQMNAQEAHSRKAACPRARPARGGARSSSANSPFRSQPCGWVPTFTRGCAFQDRQPHGTQQWSRTSFISTNTRWTRLGRGVEYFPLAESQRNLRNFTWQLGPRCREKALAHRCPGHGRAVDTTHNPQRINTHQPPAAPGFLHLLLAVFSYRFCDQTNVHSMSTLKALDVTNEPSYTSKFQPKRTQTKEFGYWVYQTSLMWCSGEGNGNPLQYSCLENPTDREAWQATVHGVAKVGCDLVTKQSKS